jgi:lipoate-protein ligase A
VIKFKYVIGKSTNPYENLALESYLMEVVTEGSAIIYLWQNADTIVVGRNQNVYSECLYEKFIKTGGRVARRKSGGGAVYHDLGNLNFSIISLKNDVQECKYQNIITKALEHLGINSEYNKRNDILVNGKKFSGNAEYIRQNVICQHGTLLIHTDIARMTSYLTPQKSKLERNHVKSVETRVINLEEVSPKLSIDKMKNNILEVLNASPLKDYENEEKILYYKKMYSRKEWIIGGNI